MGPSKQVPDAGSGNVDLHYDPQGSGMDHDSYFAEVAPGIANSGNLKYKFSIPGDHSNGEEPPTGMKGD